MPEQEGTNVTEWQEKAVHYFCERPANFPTGRPYNCCESLLLTLTEYLDMDSDLIPGIGTGIGAGLSLSGMLCGSASAPVLMIGIKHGRRSPEENPQPVWSMVSQYLDLFKKRWGAINCRELTHLDLKTAKGLKQYFEQVHDYACADRLRFAVAQAVNILSQ